MARLNADGRVDVHRSLLAPERLQLWRCDRDTLFNDGLISLIVAFMSAYAILITVDSMIWTLVTAVVVIVAGARLYFLRRIGKKGGYYHRIYERRMTQQAVYKRSAHPIAPIVRVPDQGRF